MSIASEIERIQTAKTNLITDLNNSGFDIPQSTLINNVVTIVNDDVLPLIDNRYDTFLSISADDTSVGDPISVTVNTSTEATGSVNFNIGGWFDDSAPIIDGKARLDVATEFSGSVAPVGENLISVSYDGDSNYKPAMGTAVVTISKQPSSIAITQAIVDGDTLVIDYSGGTSDIGVYCESFNIGEFSWKTGCVAIFFEGQSIGIANSDNGRGNFLYDIEDIESGTYQIQVAFLGDNKYELSVSDPVNITIPSRIPLTFNIISGGTIVWKASNTALAKTIEYKLNDGSWSAITSNTGSSAPSISVSTGDIVQFRGNNSNYGSEQSYNSFSDSTAGFEVEGNIMSLIDSTGFTTATTLTSAYTFYCLFRGCTGLTSAENLVLPATTLANYCYNCMFYNCTALTTAPELPATTLASNCYYDMFTNCTALTTAPSTLPATTLANDCYRQMFQGCSSLTTAPELPASGLALECYRSMFSNCTSLTTAPELPATTLAELCYHRMFYNCSSLNYIKCLATNISASKCTGSWVHNVAASGTFVKNPNMSSWTTGDSGVPTGWTVQDAS